MNPLIDGNLPALSAMYTEDLNAFFANPGLSPDYLAAVQGRMVNFNDMFGEALTILDKSIPYGTPQLDPRVVRSVFQSAIRGRAGLIIRDAFNVNVPSLLQHMNYLSQFFTAPQPQFQQPQFQQPQYPQYPQQQFVPQQQLQTPPIYQSNTQPLLSTGGSLNGTPTALNMNLSPTITLPQQTQKDVNMNAEQHRPTAPLYTGVQPTTPATVDVVSVRPAPIKHVLIVREDDVECPTSLSHIGLDMTRIGLQILTDPDVVNSAVMFTHRYGSPMPVRDKCVDVREALVDNAETSPNLERLHKKLSETCTQYRIPELLHWVDIRLTRFIEDQLFYHFQKTVKGNPVEIGSYFREGSKVDAWMASNGVYDEMTAMALKMIRRTLEYSQIFEAKWEGKTVDVLSASDSEAVVMIPWMTYYAPSSATLEIDGASRPELDDILNQAFAARSGDCLQNHWIKLVDLAGTVYKVHAIGTTNTYAIIRI